jgi:hypothetical protein
MGMLAIAALISTAGCGLVSKVESLDKTVSVSISPSGSQSLAAGQTASFTATVTKDTGTDGVKWAISPSTGTLTGSSSTKVTYDAPATIATASSVTLTATSVADGSENATVTINLTAGVVVTTTSLPAATVGTMYDVTLGAAGGVRPYRWTLRSGVLPAGLALNADGTITGTPTGAVTPSSVRMQVADSSSPVKTASATLSIRAIANAATDACGNASGNEALIKGQYAFLMKGFDDWGTGTTYAGSFAADGTGRVTGGEYDYNDSGATTSTLLTITASGSSYTMGPDNRGCLILNTNAGTRTFAMAMSGIRAGLASKGQIMEFTDATGTGGERSNGIIRLQNPRAFSVATLSANYAFGMDGIVGSDTLIEVTGTRIWVLEESSINPGFIVLEK